MSFPDNGIFKNHKERLNFEFAFSRTFPETCIYFSSDFWTRLVPQAAHREPSIKHIILGLGSLHRRLTTNEEDYSKEYSQEAFEHYGKAINRAKELLSKKDRSDMITALIACILFVSFENQAGHYHSAHIHLQNGLRIADEHKKSSTKASSTSSDIDDIVNVLQRLDLQAMTFSDSSAPYPWGGAFERASPTSLIKTPLSPPRKFISLDTARNCLIDLCRYAFRVVNSLSTATHTPNSDPDIAKDTLNSLRNHRAKCISLMEQWDVAFKTLPRPPSRPLGSPALNTFALLRMFQLGTTIVLTNFVMLNELGFDNHLSSFTKIIRLADTLPMFERLRSPPTSPPVDLGRGISPATSSSSSSDTTKGSPSPEARQTYSEDFSLSLELGLIAPLYVTATKCRDPKLRRKAIAMLWACNSKEGVWGSRGAAVVAEWVANIEEEEALILMPPMTATGMPNDGTIRTAADVPDAARVRVTFTRADIEHHNVAVRAFLPPTSWDADWEIKEGLLRF